MNISNSFFSSPKSSKYDFFFKGDIIVVKNKIYFSSYSNPIIYDTWSADKKQNDVRNINLVPSIKRWVDIHFTDYNNKKPPTTLYHPTVLMQIGYNKYIFVLKNATYDENKKYKLIFHISTKEIVSNVTKKIQQGRYKNVRFDCDSFDKKIDNLLLSRPLVITDRNHFVAEKTQYTNNLGLTSFSESLVNNVNQNDVQQKVAFAINNYNRIPVWDQEQIGSCVGHSTCFLYTYLMVFKDVDFIEFDNCPILALDTCFSQIINNNAAIWRKTRRPLTDDVFKTIVFNADNVKFRTQNRDPNCIFSRIFPLWAAYFTPIGKFNYNITTTNAPTYPEADNGSYILNALTGFQTWGGMPLLNNNGQFTYSQFSANFSDSVTKTTMNAFPPPAPAPPDRTYIDSLYNVVVPPNPDTSAPTNIFNQQYNPFWREQIHYNISIVTVPNKQDVIISVLNQGYPITVSMTVINEPRLALESTDGLDDVLKYTDGSHIDPKTYAYHAVIAVGYTNDSNSGNYYLQIRNSWSDKFGNNGYFYMPMSFFINTTYCSSLYTAFIPGIDVINVPGVITTTTTTTIYDWLKINTGQERVFTTNIDVSSDGKSYQVGKRILISYVGLPLTDNISGVITAINGNNITISIDNYNFSRAADGSPQYASLPLFPNISANNIAGSETDITLTLGGSIGVNTIITGGQCYIYSVNGDNIQHPVQISVIAGGRQPFSTDINSPPKTQLYPSGVPTIQTEFILEEGCFVENTEIPNIRITSLDSSRFDNGFVNGRSYTEYTGFLTGYTVPYSMGVIRIIPS